jgi:DNA polymerase zeta
MTKQCLKNAAKAGDHHRKRVMDSRQFAIKMISNVTYGYTAAGFSGRMPMSELADAIVQTGRSILEASIRMVEENPLWKAKVVYGDTDSMFVQLPGRSVAEAHAIGAEIAFQVTAANARPIQLKMEKVYHPCFLVSKKRYVGYKYEFKDTRVPEIDAKGIETVRRDQCPAVVKMMEKAIKVMFKTRDLSQVKALLQRQWSKMLEGRVGLIDYIFGKEVRLGTYASSSSKPPAAIVATKKMARDSRATPRYAERVKYVVVHGAPGARLMDLVMSPEEVMLSKGRIRVNVNYYITKQAIPALERLFSLAGTPLPPILARIQKFY